ncbi:hypothetical protein AGMMS49545_18710 [Betaproteobacteria bacterium]|nr:hypothetical protein AGMMS49545_18710 [Betaproteobacteria bacterium]
MRPCTSFIPMRNAQKGGVSLLTLAIFLMLLGSMLMVGVMYLRGDQSSAEASREREALLWADNAIIGFASTYHRLPCPAEAPDGNENCGLAKGWLPVKALNLDVTLFAPGLLPMRYMVYRDESSLTTEAETHRAPAIGEPGIVSNGRLLPYDAYEPAGWDHATASDATAITDADPHSGRFAGRFFDFNNRNGLDMCETMRLVSVKLAATGSQTDFAHYLRSGAPINVAYGVALPGNFDASGSNRNRFDGVNGTDNPEMEAPDKGHGSTYDDYVRVRDFDSLMSAFGCQPVRYHAEADYEQTIDGSGDINADIAGLIQTIVADTRGVAPTGELKVVINREGIATPMLESVQSVALAYGIVEEIEGQYEDLQGAVDQTVVFASVQAAVAAAGVIVSTVTLVADVIGIVQAVTAAIASLGLNFAAYVAIAAYTVSSITSGVAIGVNIAATTLLVTAAVNTSNIAARLDVDVSKKMEALCEKADLTAAQKAIVEAKEEAEKARDDAREDMQEAKKELDDYQAALKSELDTCKAVVEDKSTADAGLICQAGSSIFASSGTCHSVGVSHSCPSASYDACFNVDSIGASVLNPLARSVRSSYQPFFTGDISTWYAERIVAELALAQIENDLDEARKRKAEAEAPTEDTITKAAESYCTSCPGTGNPSCVKATCIAEQISKLQAEYTAQLAKAEADIASLESAKTTKTDELNVLKTKIAAAHEIPEKAPDQECPGKPAVTILCDTPYANACTEARKILSQSYEAFKKIPLDNCGTDAHELTKKLDRAYCEAPAGYTLEKLYLEKKAIYEQTNEAYASLPDASALFPTISCAAGTGGGMVVILSSDHAKEVVRRVDKRSVLQ